MAAEHNLAEDRAIGGYWESVCLAMALILKDGWLGTPHQLKANGAAAAYEKGDGKFNPWLLPDLTIWTFPGQHHEVKHKNPDYYLNYRLEIYRFEALVKFREATRQPVLYTIHDHDLSGEGREGKTNGLEHWRTIEIGDLIGNWRVGTSPGWIAGVWHKKIPAYLWPAEWWKPLSDWWKLDVVKAAPLVKGPLSHWSKSNGATPAPAVNGQPAPPPVKAEEQMYEDWGVVFPKEK